MRTLWRYLHYAPFLIRPLHQPSHRHPLSTRFLDCPTLQVYNLKLFVDLTKHANSLEASSSPPASVHSSPVLTQAQQNEIDLAGVFPRAAHIPLS
jgi:hypothetical protein